MSSLFEDIPEPNVCGPASHASVLHGRLIPPQQQILLFSADDWELFIEEWAHFQKSQYLKVTRFAGANDMGVDVMCSVDGKGLQGVWDNYQCKHYKDAITPKTAIVEIAKCLWHAQQGQFSPPRKYYFMAPKDCGIQLKKLLLDVPALKEMLLDKWASWCADNMTSTKRISLEGALREYVEQFDFSIFAFRTTLDILEEHRKTPYYTSRFGGGLPRRPEAESPPVNPDPVESLYLTQIIEAYADLKSVDSEKAEILSRWPELRDHYQRQREVFYHAEALRNFARDNVPSGTFEDLQEEIFDGVVEIGSRNHGNAFDCMNAVTDASTQISITANGLISVTRIKDRRGICHQLANADRLRWKKS